ncbi:MAG TPA: NusG domain II-containing protein [Methylophilaceae bacterium]
MLWLNRLRSSQLTRSALIKPLAGDYLAMLAGLALVVLLFKTLWQHEAAAKIMIRQGDHIFATLSLNQERSLVVHGPIGDSHIIIHQGKVRFASSPCNSQYCVHQGWLNRAGQVAICLPNRVSVELIGATKNYDTLNY